VILGDIASKNLEVPIFLAATQAPIYFSSEFSNAMSITEASKT